MPQEKHAPMPGANASAPALPAFTAAQDVALEKLRELDIGDTPDFGVRWLVASLESRRDMHDAMGGPEDAGAAAAYRVALLLVADLEGVADAHRVPTPAQFEELRESGAIHRDAEALAGGLDRATEDGQ